MRKTSRRNKVIIVAASLLAVAVNAGAAWAYWTISGSGSASVTAGSAVELQVTGSTYPSSPIYPGSTSNLLVTVHNPNSFPITVTHIEAGTQPTSIDSAHAAAGCIHSGVAVADAIFGLSWPVAKNSTNQFLLPRSVKMSNASDSACQGASFGVSLHATGTSTP
jgi:hypothetical protein